MSLALGVDTGGTYTDAVLIRDEAEVIASAKSLTTRHDLSAASARPRAEVDQVVRRRDHVERMFDDHHGVALIADGLEHAEQAVEIRSVETVDGSSST